MARPMIVFIIVCIINLIIAIAYLVWSILFRKKESKKSYVIRTVIMILCPVVGIVFFAASHVLYLVFFSEPVDLEDVIFSKERVRTHVRADEESERNMVPLEEAIAVTDTDGLRALMMNIVRGDTKKTLSAISLALNSEDTETAHYAASVLQDALNEFRITVQRQYQYIMEEEEDIVICASRLVDYMNQVLEQRVLSDLEQKSYVQIMNELCELIYNDENVSMSSHQYEAICLRMLEIEDYTTCEKWCKRAQYEYPNTLSTYTCQLKLFFNSGQKERFFAVIEELKQSAIVIDSETLELMRVFR